MGYPETIRALSNINCGLASFNNYLGLRGTGHGVASSGLYAAGNVFTGVARNEIAYGMAKNGWTIGQDINMFYGYSSPQANASAMMGLMSAYTPYMFFNSYQYCFPTFYTSPAPASYQLWHGYLC